MPSDEIRYEILNVPLMGRNLAASRTPRLQPTVSEEYGDMLSGEVARGLWTVDPQDGQPLDGAGRNLQQHLEAAIAKRPHWLMPEVLADEAEEVWTSGNLTKQGARLRQLEKFCNGSKAAALVMLTEEAARFSAKPFSTVPGVKPGEEQERKTPKANLTTNPWSKDFHGDETQRAARIASICKQGTKLADALARAAQTTVGRPFRRTA